MKTINHREWYRNLGNNPFPVAFRHAPAWVFERMRSPRSKRRSLMARIRQHKAYLVANGHRG